MKTEHDVAIELIEAGFERVGDDKFVLGTEDFAPFEVARIDSERQNVIVWTYGLFQSACFVYSYDDIIAFIKGE